MKIALSDFINRRRSELPPEPTEANSARCHPSTIAAKKLLAASTIASLMVAILLLYLPEQFFNAETAMHHSDYPTHLEIAQQMQHTHTILVPHFLYQALVILIHSAIPWFDWMIAGYYIAPLLCYLFMGWALYTVIAKWIGPLDCASKALTVFILTLCFMIAGPVNLFSYPHLYLAYAAMTMNVYHNPTILLAKPFSLLAFDQTTEILQLKQRKWPFVLCALTVLGLLSKPSYLICFIPALVLLLIYRCFRKQYTNLTAIIFGVFVPSLLILSWQYVLIYTPGHAASLWYHRSIAFAPFAVARYIPDCYGLHLIVLPVLSLLFPALVYLLYLPESRKDLSLNLSWLTYLISLTYFLLLAELCGGKVDLTGNFSWGCQLSYLILFIYSTLFLLRWERSDQRRRRTIGQWLALAGCFLTWSLHIVGGLLLYLHPYSW